LVKQALPSPVPIVSTPQPGDITHERRLAQTLHHCIVVQEDHRFIFADGRDRFVQRERGLGKVVLWSAMTRSRPGP